MRHGLAIEAEPGLVASSPEASFDALVELAVADGADADEWVHKALAHAGASKTALVVRGEPRFQVIEDATHHADRVIRVALNAAIVEIVALVGARAEHPPKPPRAS